MVEHVLFHDKIFINIYFILNEHQMHLTKQNKKVINR